VLDGIVKISADKFWIKLGMECTFKLDRHINIPPIFSKTFGFILFLTHIFSAG